MQMQHKRKRQIASAVAVLVVAAIVVVVVVVNNIDINGCVASASVPEVHVLPGQRWRCCASRGGRVFPRGQRRRRSNPIVIE